MGAKIHNHGQGPRGGVVYAFHCPACGYSHPFEVEAPNGEGWAWNGSFDLPTFHPSLMVNRDYPAGRCHSFVINGLIAFQGDCFHALAGQTVELPDWENTP